MKKRSWMGESQQVLSMQTTCTNPPVLTLRFVFPPAGVFRWSSLPWLRPLGVITVTNNPRMTQLEL